MSSEFERKDFVYRLSPESVWCKVGSGGVRSVEDARNIFWRKFRGDITLELKKELDNGWEPAEEIGPDGIALQVKGESFTGWSTVNWVLYPILGLVTLGLGFVVIPVWLWKSLIARPTEFRIALRRKR
jgi:hypothetical protein